MLDRRRFLTGLTAAGLAAPVLGSAPALARTRPTANTLPLVIANQSGKFPNSAITVTIIGVHPDTGQQVHVTADGQAVPVSESDNGPGGFADYSIPLRADGDTRLSLPYVDGGRIYFALGDDLKIKVVSGDGQPALQLPAGWVPSDPNYPVLHDTIEFTHSADGMFCNTTMVDMFSVPLSLRLQGSRDQTTGTLVSGGRDKIFSGVTGNPDFARLKQKDLRVIAPGHGLDLGLFPADFYDSYVDQVWQKYQGTSMRVDAGDGKIFTGKVSGDQFRFDGGVKPISRPSTRDVLFCDGALAAPNDGVTGPVAATLGAGFNRSTLLDSADQPTTDPATFYQNDITNHYSKVMHDNTRDGKAYGFAFDDIAGFASYIEDGAPTSVAVTLTPW